MTKKICSGIGGLIRIGVVLLAVGLYVPALASDLSQYLFLLDVGPEMIPIMYLKTALFYAGWFGQLIVGLAQLYGAFRKNPLSRFAVLGLDVLMVASCWFGFSTIIEFVGEETMVEMLGKYFAPAVVAAVDMLIVLTGILRHKEKLTAAENWLVFVRSIKFAVIPVLIACMIYTGYQMIDHNIRQERATEVVRAGFSSFSMESLDGSEVYTEELFRGHKVTMVNIWGTFCHPCIEEMPELGEIARSYDPAVFQMIGIPADLYPNGELNPQKVEEAKNIVEYTNVTYPILIPTPEFQFGVINPTVFALPHTIFMDENGEQLLAVSGPRSKEEWVSIIEEVIAGET